MRVVNTDNFGGDYPDEKFIGTKDMSLEEAKKLADDMNDIAGPNASRFYKVVNDDYVLQPGFEP